jgi:hypothetical protein
MVILWISLSHSIHFAVLTQFNECVDGRFTRGAAIGYLFHLILNLFSYIFISSLIMHLSVSSIWNNFWTNGWKSVNSFCSAASNEQRHRLQPIQIPTKVHGSAAIVSPSKRTFLRFITVPYFGKTRKFKGFQAATTNCVDRLPSSRAFRSTTADWIGDKYNNQLTADLNQLLTDWAQLDQAPAWSIHQCPDLLHEDYNNRYLSALLQKKP